MISEREAGADFVAGAFGAGEGFVEEEFIGRECGYGILFVSAQRLLQRGERARSGAAFGASEGDMRVISAILGKKSARARRSDDFLLQREEFRRKKHAGVKHAGAVKESEALDADGHRRGVNLAQASPDAGGLLVKGLAEELERDMPPLFTGPAEVAAGARRKPIAQRAEDGSGLFGERDGDEQPHGRTRVPG